MTETTRAVTYTGSNAREVRDFVDAGINWIATWFVTKSMSGPTDLQAWHYIIDKAPGEETPEPWVGVPAAVYDPRSREWLPVRTGDTIARDGGSIVVRRPS